MASDKSIVFMPPNALKLKAGSRSGGGAVDPFTLKRAETAIDDLRHDFSAWLTEDVEALTNAFKAFTDKRSTTTADALFRAAHDLKGQAATFEYPLIARIAGSLAKLMDNLRSRETAPLPLVSAHIDAIHVIHRDHIKDTSNLIALTLTEELEGRVVKALAQASSTP